MVGEKFVLLQAEAIESKGGIRNLSIGDGITLTETFQYDTWLQIYYKNTASPEKQNSLE